MSAGTATVASRALRVPGTASLGGGVAAGAGGALGSGGAAGTGGASKQETCFAPLTGPSE